jgi:toxin ParE1/3/4
MRCEVLLTEGAERDLQEIYDHIADNDSQANARHVLDQLLSAAERLAAFPERGPHPKELEALGIREYRQTCFKPYRVIYRVTGRQVIILLIADGRRDMRALLARRLLTT